MVLHRIRGRSCTVDVDIPAYMDGSTKKILITILQYCLEEKYQKSATESINKLMKSLAELFGWLKEHEIYHPVIEKNVRDFVGLHLNHGFEIGLRYYPYEGEGEDDEEGGGGEKTLQKILQKQINLEAAAIELPENRQTIGSLIFHCLNLGRIAYETGLMLSVFLSEDMVEKHQEEMRMEGSYVG
ncbi:MAG: hypothetical protein HYX24_06575 [Candidatus Aenigmarchaeota archaeon]|nr:hypothetical protein [Candidatus Aenigmarchaeota archaeon]